MMGRKRQDIFLSTCDEENVASGGQLLKSKDIIFQFYASVKKAQFAVRTIYLYKISHDVTEYWLFFRRA